MNNVKLVEGIKKMEKNNFFFSTDINMQLQVVMTHCKLRGRKNNTKFTKSQKSI